MSIEEILPWLGKLFSNPGVIAIATAAITTVGVKFVENRGKGKELKIDESTSLRIELRAEIDKLRKQLDEKEISLEKWREKYYTLIEKYNDAENRYRVAKADLDEALQELKRLKPPNSIS